LGIGGKIISNGLNHYIRSITDGVEFSSGILFAKILAENDDSGRHGVLIPKASYGFFPDLPTPDPEENARVPFSAVEVTAKKPVPLSWIYYHRYPERRVTRLDGRLNNRDHGRRLVVFSRVTLTSGKIAYFVECALEHEDPRFSTLVTMLFPEGVSTDPGSYVSIPLDAPGFAIDEDLNELLSHFDQVSSMGWVDSLRTGDTGIGYTFETLIGIKENNDQRADFRGIEIKCKLRKERLSPSGKINLFQHGPRWSLPGPNRERLKVIGAPNEKGILSCHSQVSTTPNNRDLWVNPAQAEEVLHLFKSVDSIGYWRYQSLAKRLMEKHSRAVFIKAERRSSGERVQYSYKDLLYCERPDISRFLSLVDARRIVFEFLMHLNENGRVRNRGYPWRLVDERDLEQLFALQLQLRQGSN